MIYGVVLEFQKDEIEALCFGKCGKILFGGMDLPMPSWGVGAGVSLLPCREEHCPYQDGDALAVGDVDGEEVYVRKLRMDGAQ